MANEKQQPNTDPEAARLKKEEQSRKARRRNRQLLGLTLSILIVVGAFSIIRSGVDLVSTMLDDSAESDAYNRRIAPIVWFDLLPFDSLDQVEETMLKQVCIWGVLDEQGSTLERNDRGEPLIPVALVDQYAHALFGPTFAFTSHGAFEYVPEDLRYGFDEETQTYAAPNTSLMPTYISTVMNIQRESGGIKRVTVGYVNTRSSDDRLIDTPDLEHPVKYLDYMFRRDGNEYYLYALHSNTSYVPPNASSASAVSSGSEEESGLLSSESVVAIPVASASAVSGGNAEESAADTNESASSTADDTSGASPSTSDSSSQGN